MDCFKVMVGVQQEAAVPLSLYPHPMQVLGGAKARRQGGGGAGKKKNRPGKTMRATAAECNHGKARRNYSQHIQGR